SAFSGVAGALAYRRRSRRQALLRAVRGYFIPYDVGSLITLPDRYIGRQHVLDTILGKIDHNNFYLYCEKALGQTTLLFQLKQRLLQRNALPGARRYFAVFRNMQELPQEHFWRYLIRSIAAEVADPPALLVADESGDYDDLDAEQDLERIVLHSQKQW